MNRSEFSEVVDSASRDEDAYLSIDRLRISKEFLDSLRDEDPAIGAMSVDEIVTLMEEML